MPLSGHSVSLFKLGLFAACFACGSANGFAEAINTGTYYEFHFDGVGSYSSTCSSACTQPTDPTAVQTSGVAPYTFTLTGTGNFTVQDILLGGDRFAIYDSGVLLGDTGPTVDSASCGADIGTCSLTAGISRNSFLLGPGSYSITIKAIQSDSGAGSAVFEAQGPTASPTPEPSSLMLLGTGLLGMIGAARRRLNA